MNWYKKAKNMNKQEEFFVKRTNEHIDKVKENAEKIVKEFPEFSELLDKVKEHDSSKFKEPERTPYISITWRKKINNDNNLSKKEKEKELEKLPDEKKENEITLYHIKNNSHHPEYHLKDKDEANISAEDRDKSDKCVDASLMPDIDIAEMVSDWQAVSDELQKNTAREWFNKQKDTRWKFSKEQEKLIDKLLKVFE